MHPLLWSSTIQCYCPIEISANNAGIIQQPNTFSLSPTFYILCCMSCHGLVINRSFIPCDINSQLSADCVCVVYLTHGHGLELGLGTGVRLRHQTWRWYTCKSARTSTWTTCVFGLIYLETRMGGKHSEHIRVTGHELLADIWHMTSHMHPSDTYITCIYQCIWPSKCLIN